MSPLPTTGLWLQTLGLLAAQSTLLLVVAGLSQGLAHTPQSRRRVWLATLAAVALLLANSLAGLDRYLARQFTAKTPSAPEVIVRANLPVTATPTGVAASETSLLSAAVNEPGLSSDVPPTPVGTSWPAWLWLTGAAAIGLWSLAPRIWMAFAGRRAATAESPESQRRVQSLAGRLNIRRRVRAVYLPRLAGPVAFGVVRPSIGLPADFWTANSAAEQDAMLAHELAHLAARDPFWLALADALVAMLWWHPLVWWARRQFRAASETAADEASLVVEDGPAVLAGCLVALASRWQQRGVVGLLGMAGFRSGLGRRVERLLHLRGREQPALRRRWPGLVAWLGAVATLAMVVAVPARFFPAQAANRPALLAVVGDALAQATASSAASTPAASDSPGAAATHRAASSATPAEDDARVTFTVRVPDVAGVDPKSVQVMSMDAVTRRLLALDLFSQVRCEPLDADRFEVLLVLRPRGALPDQPTNRVFSSDVVRNLIAQSGQLQFRRVHPDSAKLIEAGQCTEDCEVLTQRADGAAPAPRFVVMRQAAANLTSTNLAEATVKRDAQYNEPRIAITFDEAGAKALAELTRDSIGQQVAIVLDGAVLMAPRVRESITGGKCEISGRFSEDEARALAAALAHPLPWKLTPEELTLSSPTGKLKVAPNGRFEMGFSSVRLLPPPLGNQPETKSPAPSGPSATLPGEPAHVISLLISQDGQLMLDRRVQTLESLQAELRSLQSASGSLVVRVSAVETVPAARVIEVVDACRAAGVTRISLVTPAEDEASVPHLFQDAKLLYEMGRLPEAQAKLETVLRESPGDPSAEYLLRLVREAAARTAKTNAGLPLNSDRAMTVEPGRKRIHERLDQIVMDQVEFPAPGVPLIEVVAFLSETAKSRNAGMNFLIGPGRNSESTATKPTEAALKNLAEVQIQLTPPLRQVRLADALAAIVQAADQPIQYSIEPYGIVFSWRAAEELSLRTYKMEPQTLAAGLEALAGKGATNLTAQEQLRALFASAGLDFAPTNAAADKPLVKALYYNDRNGLLMVRATMPELDTVEQLLQVLNTAQPQVMIEAKFVEISADANAPLGFDSYLGNVQAGTNQPPGTAPAGTYGVFPGPGMSSAGNSTGNVGTISGILTDPQFRDVIAVLEGAGTNGVRELRGDQLAWPGRDATNAANIRVTAAQGATVTGILSEPQFRVVLRALEQRAGVDVLSAPKVTTLSGRQAQIQVADMRTVVTGLNPDTVKVPGATPATNGLPFSSATIPTGPSLDVIPLVAADGVTINLTVIPTVTEFLGYDEPPKSSKVEVMENGKARLVNLPLPRFRVRQMVTQAAIRDGQTLVLGGFPVEETRLSKDKVPVLGDIPLAGGLFRSESRSTVRKQLLVFVTATIIDPAGNRVNASAGTPAPAHTAPRLPVEAAAP